MSFIDVIIKETHYFRILITKSPRNTSALVLVIKSCFRPLPTSSFQDLLSLKASAHVLEIINGGVLQEFNILISVIVENTEKAFRTRRTVRGVSEGSQRKVSIQCQTVCF